MPCGVCGDFCGGYVPLCDKCTKGNKMTNELGTTLQELEDKAMHKKLALYCIDIISGKIEKHGFEKYNLKTEYSIIRKYIEEN